YWLHMENILPHKLSDFIRDYMQGIFRCSYPVASEANYKKLYGIFKNNFKGKNSQSLLQELSGYSDIYKYVISDSSCGNENIDKQLSDLRKIKVTTSYSFVMMLMSEREQKKFTDVDIIDILEAFNIYCLRRRIMGLTSGENKVFPTLVNQIKDLEQADDKKLKMFEILSKQESMLRLPNDIELTRYMETMNFSNFQYCKFILSLIEEKLTKNRPDLTDKKLQLEHIMPQKLNEKWKIDLGSNYDNIHQTYVNTIGNLTLIRHNQELGQKPFIEKKDIYENHAGLQIARTKITDKESWNEDSIKERTNWMIEFLLEEVLPIPDQMRKVNNFNVKNIKGLSFQSLQLIGLDINFIYDPTITAHVINDKEVEFEGTKWKLSPLTREIQTRRGAVNKSGAYQGAQYWEYDGIKLADII
ncbi:MAG: HNH endonuclease family protein, partial [Clostridia bacterium]|nr:HNH endonuclease family protein [Clostridia bacterium]MDY5554680.1 HNH endonuclease family protein [Blautia sp.]